MYKDPEHSIQVAVYSRTVSRKVERDFSSAAGRTMLHADPTIVEKEISFELHRVRTAK